MFQVLLAEIVHNRPKSFIKHCLQKVASSEEVQPKHISVINAASNIYQVSNPYNGAEYEVAISIPSCSCKDFLLTNLPSKRIFAIKYFENVTWEKISSSYRSSTFIALDFEARFENDSLQDKRSLAPNFRECSDLPIDYDELATTHLHLAHVCRHCKCI